MKRYFCFILAATLLLLASGCANSSNSPAVLPPSRIGASSIHASLANVYTFKSAFSEADVVARVEVGSWLAEDTDLHKTYYEATVLQCFKGEIPDTFTLLQDGCSTATMKGYPLFTDGNEILVFLNEASVTEYDSPYWIIGSFTTFLDVSYDESGTRYYADRYGILGETINILSNYAQEDKIFNEVRAQSIAKDPLVSEMQYSYPYIFSETDLITLIAEQ